MSAPAPHPTNPVRRDVVVTFASRRPGGRDVGAVYFGATPAQAARAILDHLQRDADAIGWLARPLGELVILDAADAPILRPVAQVAQGLTPGELAAALSSLRS